MNSNYSVILTIVNKGYSDAVMDAARAAGARGGTIINARGTGTSESGSFFGIEIHPEKELVLIVTSGELRHSIMTAIYKEVGLDKDGGGFSFSMPVDEIVGTARLTTNNNNNSDNN